MSTRSTPAQRAEWRLLAAAAERLQQAGATGADLRARDLEDAAHLYDDAPEIVLRLLDALDEIDAQAEAMLVKLRLRTTI